MRRPRGQGGGVNMTTIGPGEEKLVNALDAKGLLAIAELAGLQRGIIVSLAHRLNAVLARLAGKIPAGGIAISGTVASIGGDVVGGDQITVNLQSIDPDIREKISQTNDRVAQLSETIKPSVTRQSSILEQAGREAELICSVGRPEDASRAFMEALDREERVERQRLEDYRWLRLQLLEQALVYDETAMSSNKWMSGDAALKKLLLIAETNHPSDQDAQVQYLSNRASEYEDRAKTKASNEGLFIALSIYRWLAQSKGDSS